jgi:hypothetical protein
MSRLHALQATLLIAALTVVAVGAATLHAPDAEARATTAATSVGGAGATPAGRVAPGADLSPQWFGKFWKKFKAIFSAIIDFIDRVIDTTVELVADAAPDGSTRPDRWSPTLPSFPPLVPLA